MPLHLPSPEWLLLMQEQFLEEIWIAMATCLLTSFHSTSSSGWYNIRNYEITTEVTWISLVFKILIMSLKNVFKMCLIFNNSSNCYYTDCKSNLRSKGGLKMLRNTQHLSFQPYFYYRSLYSLWVKFIGNCVNLLPKLYYCIIIAHVLF